MRYNLGEYFTTYIHNVEYNYKHYIPTMWNWPLKLWFIQGSRPSVDYLLEKLDSCIDNLESCLYEFMELV